VEQFGRYNLDKLAMRFKRRSRTVAPGGRFDATNMAFSIIPSHAPADHASP